MHESKAAVCEWDEIHALAQKYAKNHDCIQMGAALVCHGAVCFTFKPGSTKAEQKAFYELIKPFDHAGFWKSMPDYDENGWITLPEDITRRVIDEVAGLSFQVGDVLFLHDGVLLLEKPMYE